MESADHSACCGHKSATTALHQTVDEIEFERGIWKAVIDADLGRVKELLGRDRTCINKRDNSGYTALVRVSHLSHLNGCFPIWVAVLQASQLNQRVPSYCILYVIPVKAILLEVRLDGISPPFLIYVEISYLSNVFIFLLSIYMAKPLDSPLPHAHRDWFHFRFLSNVLISHMIFPIDILDVPQHSHLCDFYPIFLSLCNGPGFVSIQERRSYSCFIKKILEFSWNLLITQ